MKCPKCGYQSFNDLTNCKKCGRDLTEVQARLNFGNPVVVTAPPQEHTSEPLPDTANLIDPSAKSSQESKREQQHPGEEDGEHLLEDFFQSIDTPQDVDPAPSSAPQKDQKHETAKANKTRGRKNPDELPQWQPETPQGDFPFDELDADLDALNLSTASDQAQNEASPFDDVDSFELNWQLPIEEDDPFAPTQEDADIEIDELPPVDYQGPPQAAAVAPESDLKQQTEPPVINSAGEDSTEQNRPEPTTAATQPEKLLSAPEPAAVQQSTKPPVVNNTVDELPKQNQPEATTEVARPETLEEEWLLPEVPADLPAEEEFSLAEPGETKSPAKQAEPNEGPAYEIQGELPLAAEAVKAPTRPGDMAEIFLTDSDLDSIASGAQLLARRAKAYLTDVVLLTTIFALFICAGEIARTPASGEWFRFTGDVLLDLAAPYFLVFFALCFGYFILFHYLSGQTPGKMLFALRVEGDDQSDLTLSQAFLRCVGGLIALLPAGLGYLSIVLDGEHKGWNDRLAGCRVVLVEEPEEDKKQTRPD